MQVSHHGFIAVTESVHASPLDPELVADQPEMPSYRDLAEWPPCSGCKEERHLEAGARNVPKMSCEARRQNTDALTPGGFSGLDSAHPDTLVHSHDASNNIDIFGRRPVSSPIRIPVSAANQNSVFHGSLAAPMICR